MKSFRTAISSSFLVPNRIVERSPHSKMLNAEHSRTFCGPTRASCCKQVNGGRKALGGLLRLLLQLVMWSFHASFKRRKQRERVRENISHGKLGQGWCRGDAISTYPACELFLSFFFLLLHASSTPPEPPVVWLLSLLVSVLCRRPQQTKLMTFIQPDIRGMLPRSLVDSAIPGSMVDFFNNLRACLKADGKLID